MYVKRQRKPIKPDLEICEQRGQLQIFEKGGGSARYSTKKLGGRKCKLTKGNCLTKGCLY